MAVTYVIPIDEHYRSAYGFARRTTGVANMTNDEFLTTIADKIKRAMAAQDAKKAADAEHASARAALDEALKSHPMVGHVVEFQETRGYGSKATTVNRRMLVESVTLYTNGYGERQLLRAPLLEGSPVLANGSKGTMRMSHMIDQATDAGLWEKK
jgi:hypothetical protein